jgi:HEAT repeat protein
MGRDALAGCLNGEMARTRLIDELERQLARAIAEREEQEKGCPDGDLLSHVANPIDEVLVRFEGIHDPAAIPDLIQMLMSGDAYASDAATRGLIALGPPCKAPLLDDFARTRPAPVEESVKARIAGVLCWLGDVVALDVAERYRGRRSLLWELASPFRGTGSGEPRQRDRLAALRRIGWNGLARFVPDLSSTNAEDRAYACTIFGCSGDARAVPLLAARITDDSHLRPPSREQLEAARTGGYEIGGERVKEYALWAFYSLARPDTGRLLASRMAEDPDSAARHVARCVLSHLGKATLPAVEAALRVATAAERKSELEVLAKELREEKPRQ